MYFLSVQMQPNVSNTRNILLTILLRTVYFQQAFFFLTNGWLYQSLTYKASIFDQFGSYTYCHLINTDLDLTVLIFIRKIFPKSNEPSQLDYISFRDIADLYAQHFTGSLLHQTAATHGSGWSPAKSS